MCVYIYIYVNIYIYLCVCVCMYVSIHIYWLVLYLRLCKNMSSAVGMMTFPIYGKIEIDPNHQPGYIFISVLKC